VLKLPKTCSLLLKINCTKPSLKCSNFGVFPLTEDSAIDIINFKSEGFGLVGLTIKVLVDEYSNRVGGAMPTACWISKREKR